MWRLALLFRKGKGYLRRNGFAKTLRKAAGYLRGRHAGLFRRPAAWVPEPRTLQRQRDTVFPDPPLISILVPLYNTPLPFLKEMLNSVCAQSYPRWQLCMADGSDGSHAGPEDLIGRAVREYPGKIKYRRLEKNGGISENTNACIALADGAYLALLDHDDVLSPDALFEAVKAITERHADFVYTDEATFDKIPDHISVAHFKPDYAPDNLRANNYICHFTVFSKGLLKKTGAFRREYDGSQDHDMILRLTDAAEKIVHIPKILYYWRMHPNSVASGVGSKAYAVEAGKKAVADQIRRDGMEAQVESSEAFPTIYRIRYRLTEKPLISILIENRDSPEAPKDCVGSVGSSSYRNYEIVVADAGSKDAAEKARGKYLILLDRDMRVLSPGWIEEMLMYAQRPDVGAVGAKLYYRNGRIRHAGMILGAGAEGIAANAFDGAPKTSFGYMRRLLYAQDVSAVSGACMMVRKSLFDELGGLDGDLSAFRDVDFCLRLRKKGYLVVFTPYAELRHDGPRARGAADTPERRARVQKDARLFKRRWQKVLAAGDPYYNPNLSLETGDYRIRGV